MTVEKREKVVEEHAYCKNCLAKSHELRWCTSMATCHKCDHFHHTLLHPPDSRDGRKGSAKGKRRSHQQQNRPTKKRSLTITSSSASARKRTAQPSTPADTRTIVDAIRSLANVLCSKESN